MHTPGVYPLSFRHFLHLFLLALVFISCRSTKHSAGTSPASENTSASRTVARKYATLLGVEEKHISNVNLYSFIDEWYGVPYKYGGKNKSGIDCSNFATILYRQIYQKPLSGSSAMIFENCQQVKKSDLTEGDLVFFKIDGDRISHIGVYLMNNKFVHATTKKGVMIDDLETPYYKKHYYRSGRPK